MLLGYPELRERLGSDKVLLNPLFQEVNALPCDTGSVSLLLLFFMAVVVSLTSSWVRAERSRAQEGRRVQWSRLLLCGRRMPVLMTLQFSALVPSVHACICLCVSKGWNNKKGIYDPANAAERAKQARRYLRSLPNKKIAGASC